MNTLISNKMHLAIKELSNLSVTAKNAAGRLNASLAETGTELPKLADVSTSAAEVSSLEDAAPSALVSSLKEQILRLQELVSNLQTIIEDDEEDDAVFTDIQAHAFTESLELSLNDLAPVTICSVYSESYFKKYPRNLRALISTVLVNHCSTKGIEPMPIWHSLMANAGAMRFNSNTEK